MVIASAIQDFSTDVNGVLSQPIGLALYGAPSANLSISQKLYNIGIAVFNRVDRMGSNAATRIINTVDSVCSNTTNSQCGMPGRVHLPTVKLGATASAGAVRVLGGLAGVTLGAAFVSAATILVGSFALVVGYRRKLYNEQQVALQQQLAIQAAQQAQLMALVPPLPAPQLAVARPGQAK